jgi:TonB family protein
MPRDARFWRNVTISALAHIAVIVTLVGWKHERQKPNLQSIVWMNGGGIEAAAQSTPLSAETEPEETPSPEALHSKPEDEPPAPTPGRSDLQLPAVTPSPPKPSMTPASNPSAKPAPKPALKASRKRPLVAKVTPKPSSKTTPAEQERKEDENKKETAKITPTSVNSANSEESGSAGPGGNAVRASEFSWYGKMLHDRFYREWLQPTTSIAVGAKISVVVRIRIARDGGVTSFAIVKPSGNVVVDESVAAVAKRVTQVDPLPQGLAGGAFYEVNINFELNPHQ